MHASTALPNKYACGGSKLSGQPSRLNLAGGPAGPRKGCRCRPSVTDAKPPSSAASRARGMQGRNARTLQSHNTRTSSKLQISELLERVASRQQQPSTTTMGVRRCTPCKQSHKCAQFNALFSSQRNSSAPPSNSSDSTSKHCRNRLSKQTPSIRQSGPERLCRGSFCRQAPLPAPRLAGPTSQVKSLAGPPTHRARMTGWSAAALAPSPRPCHMCKFKRVCAKKHQVCMHVAAQPLCFHQACQAARRPCQRGSAVKPGQGSAVPAVDTRFKAPSSSTGAEQCRSRQGCGCG